MSLWRAYITFPTIEVHAALSIVGASAAMVGACAPSAAPVPDPAAPHSPPWRRRVLGLKDASVRSHVEERRATGATFLRPLRAERALAATFAPSG